MGLLSWIVVGLIAGWLSGLAMRRGGYGVAGDIIAGTLGSILGGWISFTFFNINSAGSGLNLVSILIAFVGAMLLIVILRIIGGKMIPRNESV